MEHWRKWSDMYNISYQLYMHSASVEQQRKYIVFKYDLTSSFS